MRRVWGWVLTKRVPAISFIFLVGFLSLYQSTGASDFGHWSEYGVNLKLKDKGHFKGNIQVRFRDNAKDHHYIRLELGHGVKIFGPLGFGALYRFNPQEARGQWNSQHYLLIDQTLKTRISTVWGVDLLSRFQVRLGDRGRSFWRVRPRVSHYFPKRSVLSSWFLANEFYAQISELGQRSRFNQNRLSTGFGFNLRSRAALSLYYLVRSDKAAATSAWTHIHVIGSSLYLRN